MIKFFRQIRYRLMNENPRSTNVSTGAKTGRYVLYAFGEIILVVIGILFALQVNNWNQQRIEQNTIQGYYAKLVPALGIEIEDQKRHLARLEVFRNDFYRSLEILDAKNPADIEELKLKIARLGQAFVHNYSMELFDEFLSKGFLTKLEEQALKSQFETIKRFLAVGASWDALLDDEYISIIKPFRIKNLDFSIIPVNRSSLQNENPKGGPEFDYTNLFNNKEAWNIVYGRLTSLNTTIRQKNEMLDALQKLKATLEVETISK